MMTFWKLEFGLLEVRVILRGKLGYYGKSKVLEIWLFKRDETTCRKLTVTFTFMTNSLTQKKNQINLHYDRNKLFTRQ